MKDMQRRIAVVVAALFFSGGLLGAQDHPNVAKGFWADHAFDLGGIDHVNEFSGNLILTIPLGQTYHGDGNLEYRVNLVYDGQIWDAREGAPGTTAVRPSAIWNAGLGFLVTLGRILPANSSLNPDDELLYLSPDGAKRRFFSTLHPEDADEDVGFQFTRYSRDGSYLRLRITGNPATSYELDFPDGSVHIFDALGRLGGVVDPYFNVLAINYTFDGLGNETWTLDDAFRHHEIEFELRTIDGVARQMVKQIRLEAFAGSIASYDFTYTNATVLRSCPDTDPGTTTNATLTFLTSVILPDGSSYAMPLASSYVTDATAGNCKLSGVIKRLELPSLGALEWDMQVVNMPEESVSDDDGNRKLHWSKPVGVKVRRKVRGDDNDTVEGTWQYVHQLGPRDPQPNPAAPRWKKTTIVSPLGDMEEHFFSVWPEDFPAPSGGWDNTEYGLPFTREFVDGASSTFLSTRVSDCDPNPADPTLPLNCVLVRSTWVRYGNDTETSSLPLEDEAYRNQRLAGSKTIFHDDGDKYTQVDWTVDDGLGHFRNEVRSGNFPANATRTAVQNFNPLRETYPGAGWVEISADDPWLLGTSASRVASESSEPCTGSAATQTAKEEYCFDSVTGALRATRTYKQSTGAISADDVLRVWTRDASTGNVVSEIWAGGDGSGLSTSATLCALADSPPASSFRLRHSYSSGSRATSNYADDNDGQPDPQELQFLILDRTIDPSTGLPSLVRDVAGLETALVYDAMGRLTQVRPDSANGAAWEEFSHVNAQGGDPFVGAKVLHTVYQNGGFSTLLLDEKAEFDDFGRIHRESRKRGGDYDDRFTYYNGNGWKAFVSEWGRDNVTGEYGVESSEFDPFGRPSKILRRVPGRDDVVEAGFSYLGEREVARTVAVGSELQQDGEIGPVDATTTERYDHYGRLVEVEEPSGAGGSLVVTRYGYDVGNRLRKARTISSPEQKRCWEYDQRGFLASEQHPEKGAGGNGNVAYSSFDPMGHARQKNDSGTNLAYTFDRASRLTKIQDLHGAGTGDDELLKEWRFGTPLSTPDRLGRLEKAISMNYAVVNGNPITARIEESFSYLEPGGRLGNRFVRMCYGTGDCTPANAVEAYTHSEDFDARGQRTGITYPVCDPVQGNPTNCPVSSRVVRNVVNSYDLGFLTGVQGWATIAYHPSELWDSITHGNGVVDKQLLSLDRRGRPKLLTSTKSAATLWRSGTFRYDPAGNITGLGQTGADPDELATVIFPDENGGIDRFLYDPVQRLTGSWLSVPNGTPSGCIFCDDFDQGSTCLWSAEEPPSNCFSAPESPEALRRSQLYEFDEYGNIQSIVTDGSPLPTTTSESTNRLLSQGAIFDTRGNLTTWSLTNFVYDALNRMSRRVVAGEPVYHFLYTADDERILSVAAPSGQPLEYHWTLRDFGGKVLREYVNGPTALLPAHDYIFRGDQPLGEVDFTTPSPTTYHLTLDHLGTPRLKTSTTGAVVQKWKYFPFGEEAIPAAQAGTALRFTGHERDRFSLGGNADDIDYMHARFESPPVGRFLGVDSNPGFATTPQSWNRYTYAQGAPLKYVDRDGREVGLAYDAWDTQLASGAISLSTHESRNASSASANALGALGASASLAIAGGGEWAFSAGGVLARFLGPRPEVASAIAAVAAETTSALARSGSVTLEQSLEAGTVRSGGALESVLGAVQRSYVEAGGSNSALSSLEIVAKAAGSVGLEVGVLSPGSGPVTFVLRNVGGVTTSIFPNGEIVMQRGSVVLLKLVPKTN